MAGFESHLDDVVYIIDKQLGLVEEEIMKEGVRCIQRHTPVDTGRLKRNMTYEKTAFGWAWVNETPYTSYVEQGTPRMAPRAMFRKGIADLTSRLPSIIESISSVDASVSSFGVGPQSSSPGRFRSFINRVKSFFGR